MDSGILCVGGMFGVGQVKIYLDVKYNVCDVQGKVDGFNVGFYVIWQEDQKLCLGSYIDIWVVYSWYNNKVISNCNDEDYNSEGFVVFVEVGYVWVILFENECIWKIEFQVQVIYSYFDQENYMDCDGVWVMILDNDSVFGCLGVKFSYFQ